MFKLVLVTLSAMGLGFSLLAQPALSKKPSIDVNAKETATGKDKTPWDTKTSPPDVVMKSTSKKTVKSAKDKALGQKGHAKDFNVKVKDDSEHINNLETTTEHSATDQSER
jgi:hypothetical protein